jgi:hypothetical protein
VGSLCASSSFDRVLHSAAEMNIRPQSAPVVTSVSARRSADEAVGNALADDQDHYTALRELVAEASRDQIQLRRLAYEFARIKLRKELYPLFLVGAWSEIEQQLLGLERSIVRVEADFAQTVPHLATTAFLPEPSEGRSFLLSDTQRTSTFGASPIRAELSFLGVSPNASLGLHNPSAGSGNSFLGKHLHSRFWRNTQLLLAAAIGFAIYAAADPQLIFKRQGSSSGVISVQKQPKADVDQAKAGIPVDRAAVAESGNPGSMGKPRAPAIAIPAEYGVYALSGGKLIELDQLPIKVPDPRVAISAAFPVPSTVHVAGGQLQFVAYRRDLANSTPDHVAVRVVAQVMQALSFDSQGHAKTAAVDQTWVVRNKSYELSVGPFADNPEMVVMRSEVPNLVLPAGRYALVLKGVGYDFTVEGGLTDKAHCLERTNALDASFYSECRKL